MTVGSQHVSVSRFLFITSAIFILCIILLFYYFRLFEFLTSGEHVEYCARGAGAIPAKASHSSGLLFGRLQARLQIPGSQ